MGPILIPLSERTRRVLASLLAVEGPRSVAQISSELGLTPAQVRYCLRYLEPWLGERGVRLQKTPRIGISIDAPPAVRRSLLDETRLFGAAQLILSREERLQLLVLRLLLAKSPLSLPALAREFGVSRSTLFRDLSAARKWLRQRRLRARTRRGTGVQIHGSETCWRDSMVELLLSNLDAGTFIAACVLDEFGSPAPNVNHSAVLVRAHEFLQSLDLEGADRMVSELETALEGALVDRAHMELVLHAALAVRRAQTGHGVDQPDAARPCTATVADGQLPAAALRWLQQNFHRLPAAERGHVARKVCQAISAGLVPKHGPGSPGHEDSHPAGEAAGLLAKEAAKYLHARLFHDEELINCLALELSRADAESWSNASPAELQHWGLKAPANALYGFTQRMLCPIIESCGYLPSEQLLSSIAMHLETALQRLGSSSVRRKVWVVCGSGVATARNLISRLNLHLPQLGVMGLASAFELARDPAMVRRADAIISTVPLGWVTGIQVLQVSPLLTEEDVTMLRSALHLDPPRAAMAHVPSSASGLSLIELLTPRTVQKDAVAHDWEEVVDCAGALLLAVGAVWPSYIEAMKDMIRLYGPYVVVAPGAALLHAGPEMGGKRLSMSLVTLRYPVPFGHMANDPVRVALAFSSIDHSTHVRAVGEAMALLSNGAALDALREAPTAEHMLQVIQDTTAVES